MSSQSQEYLLFIGDHYYPLGGWDDYKGTFLSLEEAKGAWHPIGRNEWAHIVFDGEIVSYHSDSGWVKPA